MYARFLAAFLVMTAAIAAAASSYFAAFFNLDPGATQAAMITIALLWMVTFVNMVSPRFVGQVDGPLLIAGLVPLLLVAIVGED